MHAEVVAAPVSAGRRKLRDALILVGAVGVVALSAALTPSPNGYGTHERLGLPPCLFRQIVGANCPTCGMTTAFTHFARGELIEAIKCNIMSPVVALLVLAQVPFRLYRIFVSPIALPNILRNRRFDLLLTVLILGAWIVNVMVLGGHR